MDKWDKRFIELAQFIAGWSKDPSTQVGSVIVDPNHRIISLGFNGLARGVPDKDIYLNDRSQKYPRIIHAEQNAILFANRSLENCTIYVWPMPPCARCASVIIQSGIKRVVSVKCSDELLERWIDMKMAFGDFEDSGVQLVLY